MNEQPLVSIITPCLNGEKFVHRYFDSILAQTYQNIEVFFINNGSTDKTEEIALEYKEKLESRGISMTYIDIKENVGISSAMNVALPLFHGDYLTWPDSDDWMTPNCIEKKVRYLEGHPDKGFVVCKAAIVSEEQLDRVTGIWEKEDTSSGRIFEDLLTGDAIFSSCIWMVRAKAMLEVLPGKEIYPSPWGCNHQLLMPVAYRYECGFIEEVLVFYLFRANSTSHVYRGFQGVVEHEDRVQDIMEHTLASISMTEEERQDYRKKIWFYRTHRKLMAAALFHEGDAVEAEYQNLLRENMVTRLDWCAHLYGKYRIIALAYWPFRQLKKIIRKLKWRNLDPSILT